MPRTTPNSSGIELEYDTVGSPADPTLVLVMGLGAQMTAWSDQFRTGLADRGFHVLRFDNRDSGLSTFLDAGQQPDLRAIAHGDPSTAPYLLGDMALDAVWLLDRLGIERAHLVGASMGGMIVQQLAIDHPERMLSLCSIMSRPGDSASGLATPEAGALLSRPRPQDREEAIAAGIQTAQTLGSPDYPEELEEMRARTVAALERSSRADGFVRQYAAILASPDRTPGLHGVSVPTLVIHGASDPLIDHSGGEATARAVPGAELLVIPGMGHNLPDALRPQIVDAIAANAVRAGSPADAMPRTGEPAPRS